MNDMKYTAFGLTSNKYPWDSYFHFGASPSAFDCLGGLQMKETLTLDTSNRLGGYIIYAMLY